MKRAGIGMADAEASAVNITDRGEFFAVWEPDDLRAEQLIQLDDAIALVAFELVVVLVVAVLVGKE